MFSVTTIVWTALLLALAVAAMLGPLVARRSPTERLSRTVGLQPPEPPLLATIDRRGRRLARWRGLGIAIGTVVSIGVTLIAVAAGAIPDPATLLPWIGLTGVLLGAAGASLLAVLTDPTAADPEAPRVAHTRAVRLRDYVDPLEMDGARIVVALGTLGALASIFWPTASGEALQLIAPVSAIGAVLGLGFAELGGRGVLLARPRIADSPAALAWDDALRANDLRTLYTPPIMLGLYATVFGSSAVATRLLEFLPQTVALVLINVGFYLAVAALIAILVISISRRPGRYYLRRLWPELVPDGAR